MKHLIIGILATVMILNSSMAQNTISNAEYGFYHNEALKMYYAAYPTFSPKNSEEVINNMTSQLEIKYPNEFKNVDKSAMIQAFKTISPYNFSIQTYWDLNKNGLSTKGIISQRIFILADDLLKNSKDYDAIVSKISSFKNSNTLNDLEKKNIEIMESILKSSQNYWTSNNAKYKPKPGSQAIVADMLGGLMWCYSGPMAIIMGGICSLYVNEAVER